MDAASQPQGRFYLGWVVVFAAGCSAFAEVAFYNPVLGVFIPQFESEFGWSRTEISAGVTLGSFVGAALAMACGPLIDRHGGRIFVVGGGLLIVLGLVMLSLMQTQWQFFLIYAIGRGTTAGAISLAAGVTVAKWFIRRRSIAIGAMSLGTRAGVALLPLGVQLIIDTADWRTAALVLAGTVVMFGTLPALLWLHPRPERFGLKPDGDSSLNLEALRALRPQNEVNWTQREAVRTRAFWLITLSLSLQFCAQGAINLHQIPHLVQNGLSPNFAALTLSIFACFAAVGALFEAILDHRMGARWTLVIGLIGSAAGMVILISADTEALALAYSAVYGVAFGLMVTSSQVIFADYFGRESLGSIRGSASPFLLGMNAIGPIIGGVAFDLTGNYTAAFVPFTIFYLLAAVGMSVASRPDPSLRLREMQPVESGVN